MGEYDSHKYVLFDTIEEVDCTAPKPPGRKKDFIGVFLYKYPVIL